ncbi:MAG: PAS domain S-box protein, partial [Undibacterium sp.]|nr:PAS domain S-box protein [Undibacterium sp.]
MPIRRKLKHDGNSEVAPDHTSDRSELSGQAIYPWKDLINFAAGLAALFGLFAMVGWAFSIPLFKSVLPGAIEMKANTALGILASASSLYLLHSPKAALRLRLAQLLAGLTLLIGAATLSQQLFAWELGIDELLFRDNVDTLFGTRGRMASFTALGLICIGTSLILMSLRSWRVIKVVLSLLTMFIAAISLLGYFWNANEIVTDRMLPPVAINTALAFLLIAVSTLYSGLRVEQEELRNRLVEKKILFTFISAFVLLVLVGGYAYRASAKLADSIQQLNQIQRIHIELAQLYGMVADIEAVQRHYLISGNPQYKTEFQRLYSLLSTQLQQDPSTAKRDPKYHQTFDVLRALILQRMNTLLVQLETSVPQRDFSKQQGTLDDGIQTMSRIRNIIDSVTVVETKRLSQGEVAISENRLLNLVLLLSTLALLIFIFAILFFGVRTEIRSRTKVEAQLRDSSVRMQTLLSTVVDGVITMNQSGIIETVNPAAERLFGYAASEIIGSNLNRLMPEPHDSQHNDGLPHFEFTGEVRVLGKHIEVLGLHKDGRDIALDLAVSEMTLNGEPHFTGIVRDITSNKKAEAVLRASEERYRMLFNSMDEGFCVIEMIYDAQFKAVDYRFIEINREFIKQTGLHDALTKTMLEMVPEHDAIWFEIYDKVVKTGESIRLQNPANAMQRYYDVFASRIDGENSHRVGVLFKDITERRRIEVDLMEAKEQAELANHTKDSFLATMSHEIRTPLTGMLGMLELLSMTHLEAEQLATLNSAWGSARALLRIVNDILDWSKIQEGKLQLTSHASSIPQILQNVTNTYSRVASIKALVLRQHTDTQIAAAHLLDPLRLSQILNNFVSNAIKFTPHGEVVIRADLVAQLEKPIQRIRFSVSDTGIGISKEDQAQLFQRYQQGGSGTARMYGGTGLGLAICRNLAELMDGEISQESELGQGATFSLTLDLPVTELPEVQLQSMHHELEQRTVMPLYGNVKQAPTVLAVDDHPVNRNLLARQLALLGLQVETAEDGRKALSMWQTGRFALIISDCHMPEMDGYDLSKTIRAIEAAGMRPRTPIIAWTANALGDEFNACMTAGMDELLVKPNNLTQLKNILKKYLPSAAMYLDQTPAVDTANHTPDTNTDTDVNPVPIINFEKFTQVVPDPNEQLKVLQDFCDYLRVDCAVLTTLQEQMDYSALHANAHRMKGSCRMVSAEPLAQACLALELAAKEP